MRKSRPRRTRGFALFAVIILLAVVTAAVALSLDEAVSSIHSAGRVRAAELIKGGLDDGLDVALDWLQAQDPYSLSSSANDWDIFKPGGAGSEITDISPRDYAATGTDYANNFSVHIGLRPGQRTRAPEGEDVTKAYGQIVEIQLSVDTTGANGGSLPPAEERVAVGVLIPRAAAHAQ